MNLKEAIAQVTKLKGEISIESGYAEVQKYVALDLVVAELRACQREKRILKSMAPCGCEHRTAAGWCTQRTAVKWKLQPCDIKRCPMLKREKARKG